MKKNPGKILMISESAFPADIRPKNEAFTLVDAGYEVKFIALNKHKEKDFENVRGVRVYRIPQLTLFKKTRKLNSSLIEKKISHLKAVAGYMFEFSYFTIAAFLFSLYILFKEGFDVIHLHNPPDTLIFIASFYKIFGKKIVFDHHDLSPELYRTRYSKEEDTIYNLLVAFEGLCCKLSNVVICTNNSYKEIDITRHKIPSKKIHIVRNNPVVPEFEKNRAKINIQNENNKINLLFVGAINPQDGVNNLLHSLHYLVNNLGFKNFTCDIVGDGDSLHVVKSLAKELKMEDYVKFRGKITDRLKVIEYLCKADICLEPASENFLNNHSTFIKIMEYMAASKPIVAFDLKETRFSTGGSALLIKPGDIQGFAGAILKLVNDSALREQLGRGSYKRIIEELTWEKSSANLLAAYAAL